MANVIGLTGQTGAGKSSVLKLFQKRGAAVIDADSVAHRITDEDLWCLVEIVTAFSCLVLNDKGKLNRKALGKMVFSDPKKLQTLNKIIFPYICEAIRKEIDENVAAGFQTVVVDGATLIESGCSKMCTVLISVTAEKEMREKRIIARDGLNKADAAHRISAQQPENFYTEHSDFVIKNDGTPAELEQKVDTVIRAVFKTI